MLAAADTVGYSGPDAVARQFRRGKSDTIGVVFTDEMAFALADPASVSLLAGLSVTCQEAGMNMLLLPAGPPREGNRVSNVMGAVVDGFIFYSVPDGDPHLEAALKRKLPTVIVDEPPGQPGADWIGIDDRAAGRDIAKHIVGLGHQKVGVITTRLGLARHNGPADHGAWREAAYSVPRNRIAGLEDGLTASGDWIGELPIEERFENTIEAGISAVHTLLDRHPELTAICCFGDVLAMGALQGAQQRGLRVPEDISITGFDDIAEATRVGLTTVSQPLVDKGRLAGEMLLNQPLAERSRQRFLPTALNVRRSTGPAPSHR